jgi:hypothetical protein
MEEILEREARERKQRREAEKGVVCYREAEN